MQFANYDKLRVHVVLLTTSNTGMHWIRVQHANSECNSLKAAYIENSNTTQGVELPVVEGGRACRIEFVNALTPKVAASAGLKRKVLVF